MVVAMDSRRRVKVYQLDDDGKWQDKGTGHVTCSYLEEREAIFLVVKAEEDQTTLLESKILADDGVYQRQQETLIVWSEPEGNLDLALSFQEPQGCQDVWDQISSIQQKQSSGEVLEDIDLNISQDVDEFRASVDPEPELPPANIGNIDAILQIIQASALPPARRDQFVMAVLKEDYIRKLLDLFSICEDVSDINLLHGCFNIFKGLILLNDTNLMETLFSDENMVNVMGALEYDPEIPEHNRIKHREYLTNRGLFKQVVPFSSQDVLDKVHQTFRMQYLKDVALNRLLDDSTFATLNSLILFNNIEIVANLQNDNKFISELFGRLKSSSEATPQQRKELLLFIQELCTLAKNLQLSNKLLFYRSLCEQGLFNVFMSSLNDPDVATRMASTEIMLLTLTHDPMLLRSFIVNQRPNHELLMLLVSKFISDPELGVKNQIVEIMKVLLDLEPTTDDPMQSSHIRDEFITLFYQDAISELVEPLKKENLDTSDAAGDLGVGFVQSNVCELLSFCTRHHAYQVRYFLLGKDVVKKVVKLVSSKNKHLVLAAIRFLRTFIGVKDELYNKHIIKYNLLAPVMDVFERNGPRYNLINSAVLEIFDFIRKEPNMKLLVEYVVEEFGERTKGVNYVDVFKQLSLKYDQMKESPAHSETASIYSNGRKSQKQLDDEEEEDYFRESDEDDDKENAVGPSSLRTPSEFKRITVDPKPMPKTGSLVDYEDDEPTTAPDENGQNGGAHKKFLRERIEAESEPPSKRMRLKFKPTSLSPKPASNEAEEASASSPSPTSPPINANDTDVTPPTSPTPSPPKSVHFPTQQQQHREQQQQEQPTNSPSQKQTEPDSSTTQPPLNVSAASSADSPP